MGQGMLFSVPKRDLTKEKDRKPAIVNNSNMVINVSGGANFNKIEAVIQSSRERLNKANYDNLELVTDETRFREFMYNYRQNGIGAIDTETEGLNPINDKIAGINLYTPNEKGIYVPINHVDYITGTKVKGQLDSQLIVEELNKLRTVKTKDIYHNSKFDIRIMRWQLGKYKCVDMKPYWDTMIAGHLLNENEPHGLKYLYSKYCEENDNLKDLNTFGKLFKGIKFSMIPLDIAYLYAGYDPIMTYELYEFQKQFLDGGKICEEHGLKETSKLFFEIEMPLVRVVADMEDTGIAIDKEYAHQLSLKYNKQLTSVQIDINKELGKLKSKIEAFARVDPNAYSKLSNPINMGSPTQLAILLYDILKLESSDKRKPRGTGEDILEKFKTPLCKLILKLRGINKLLSTYVDKIPNNVNKKTGKLHAGFNQIGTVTGRFSSSDPNLQNIPSKNHDIRKMFVADKGCVLISGDYSQQEPRTTAHLSGDPNMLEAYRTGKDVYATLASVIFDEPYSECLEKKDGKDFLEGTIRRKTAKGVLLGLTYGMGEEGTAENLGVSREKAKEIRNAFFEGFPRIKNAVDDNLVFAKDTGFVQTIWGRKRRLTDLLLPPIQITDLQGKEVSKTVELQWSSKMQKAWGKQKRSVIEEARKQGIKIKDNSMLIAKAERQAFNTKIQGSASDITKKAMLKVANNIELKALGYKMLLPVHDELIGMCPEENAKQCKKLVEECMISAPTDRLSVPMKVDLVCTKKWYGEELEL